MDRKKLGFYRKSKNSNRELIAIFEEIQHLRYGASEKDWGEKDFIQNLQKKEREARNKILRMLQKEQIKTADDFYRASFIFHHGESVQDYALAVALAAASNHLGEPWAKNLYAVALDRFLLSLGRPQYFGTQFQKKKGKWGLLPFNRKTTDAERKRYLVEPLSNLRKQVKKLNKEKE